MAIRADRRASRIGCPFCALALPDPRSFAHATADAASRIADGFAVIHPEIRFYRFIDYTLTWAAADPRPDAADSTRRAQSGRPIKKSHQHSFGSVQFPLSVRAFRPGRSLFVLGSGQVERSRSDPPVERLGRTLQPGGSPESQWTVPSRLTRILREGVTGSGFPPPPGTATQREECVAYAGGPRSTVPPLPLAGLACTRGIAAAVSGASHERRMPRRKSGDEANRVFEVSLLLLRNGCALYRDAEPYSEWCGVDGVECKVWSLSWLSASCCRISTSAVTSSSRRRIITCRIFGVAARLSDESAVCGCRSGRICG
jgi:hypothetical protein